MVYVLSSLLSINNTRFDVNWIVLVVFNIRHVIIKIHEIIKYIQILFHSPPFASHQINTKSFICPRSAMSSRQPFSICVCDAYLLARSYIFFSIFVSLCRSDDCFFSLLFAHLSLCVFMFWYLSCHYKGDSYVSFGHLWCVCVFFFRSRFCVHFCITVYMCAVSHIFNARTTKWQRKNSTLEKLKATSFRFITVHMNESLGSLVSRKKKFFDHTNDTQFFFRRLALYRTRIISASHC